MNQENQINPSREITVSGVGDPPKPWQKEETDALQRIKELQGYSLRRLGEAVERNDLEEMEAHYQNLIFHGRLRATLEEETLTGEYVGELIRMLWGFYGPRDFSLINAACYLQIPTSRAVSLFSAAESFRLTVGGGFIELVKKPETGTEPEFFIRKTSQS